MSGTPRGARLQGRRGGSVPPPKADAEATAAASWIKADDPKEGALFVDHPYQRTRADDITCLGSVEKTRLNLGNNSRELLMFTDQSTTSGQRYPPVSGRHLNVRFENPPVWRLRYPGRASTARRSRTQHSLSIHNIIRFLSPSLKKFSHRSPSPLVSPT